MTFDTLEKTYGSSVIMFMNKNENLTKCFRRQVLHKHNVFSSPSHLSFVLFVYQITLMKMFRHVDLRC